MKKILTIILRLITVPFVTALVLFALLRNSLSFMVNYMKFGGEIIAYPKNPILIKDVYEKLEKQYENK